MALLALKTDKSTFFNDFHVIDDNEVMKFLFLNLIFILSIPAHGSAMGVEKQFALKVPSDWQQMKDFYGVPFTYLNRKSQNETRPTIQVIPSDNKKFDMDEKRLGIFDDKNKRGKERWLAKNKGYIISYEKMKKVKSKGSKLYMSHVMYKFGGKGYNTKTYYTFCSDKLIQIVSLADINDSLGMRNNDTVIKSFKCRN